MKSPADMESIGGVTLFTLGPNGDLPEMNLKHVHVRLLNYLPKVRAGDLD